METIILLKTIHIIGFVSWFAAMFYLGRIFVYHREALSMPASARDVLVPQYQLMENRVYKIIMNPAMMITWTCGLGMIALYGMEWLKGNHWLHAKILLLVGLTIFHLYSKGVIRKLGDGSFQMNSFQFRLLNEVPTVFLILITSLGVYKNTVNYGILVGSIIGIIGLLYAFTVLYRKIREGK